MKEFVVISGKGGTGKTSLVASFAALSTNAVLADCDVDAPDLPLVLSPEVRRREPFQSGHEAVIRQADCIGCGACLACCRFGAVRMDGHAAGEATFSIDPIFCEGCGVCVWSCPVKAVDFPERTCGEWFVSDTRFGPMVHARLGVAAENSGKLVATVRHEARRIALEQGVPLVLVDGPPGIGCPVIASIAGSSLILIVAEPTVSGEHDLMRALSLTRHFGIPAAICVNKWDLNPDMADRIEARAEKEGAEIGGRICYDRTVTEAQTQRRAVVEMRSAAADDVRRLWDDLNVMAPWLKAVR